MQHIARLLVEAKIIHLLPKSLLLDASFILITEMLDRTIAPIEQKLGILTFTCGAAFFRHKIVQRKT